MMDFEQAHLDVMEFLESEPASKCPTGCIASKRPALDRVFENVNAELGVKRFHFLERFEKWSNIQIVVVLQPVSEGLHPPLFKDMLAFFVLLWF